jgi:hypothetical protein
LDEIGKPVQYESPQWTLTKKKGMNQLQQIQQESLTNPSLNMSIQLNNRQFQKVATNLDTGANPGNYISYEWLQKYMPEKLDNEKPGDKIMKND